jgi:hypothetical protein
MILLQYMFYLFRCIRRLGRRILKLVIIRCLPLPHCRHWIPGLWIVSVIMLIYHYRLFLCSRSDNQG